jgi:hypothetical protein
MRKTLFVGNLSYEAGESAVRALFDACAVVTDVR